MSGKTKLTEDEYDELLKPLAVATTVTFVPWGTVAGVGTQVIAGVALRLTLMLMGADAVAPVESETRSVGVNEPAVAGVPERVPVVERLRPEGSAPVVLQV